MKSRTIGLISGVSFAVLAACDSTGSGGSDNYPDGRVELIVPYDAGSTSDTTMRAMATCLEDELNGTFTIINRAGGGGAPALNELKDSEPDGSTIGMITRFTAVSTPLSVDTGYDYEDFTYLAQLSDYPAAYLVADDSEFTTFEDLLQAGADSPGTISVGTVSLETEEATALAAIGDETGAEFNFVIEPGAAGLDNALQGGHLDVITYAMGEPALAAIQDGRYRALALGGELAALPDVPTLQSLGYSYEPSAATLMAAPRGIPEDVQAALEGAIEVCLTDEQVIRVIGESFIAEPFVDGAAAEATLAEAHSSLSASGR